MGKERRKTKRPTPLPPPPVLPHTVVALFYNPHTLTLLHPRRLLPPQVSSSSSDSDPPPDPAHGVQPRLLLHHLLLPALGLGRHRLRRAAAAAREARREGFVVGVGVGEAWEVGGSSGGCGGGGGGGAAVPGGGLRAGAGRLQGVLPQAPRLRAPHQVPPRRRRRPGPPLLPAVQQVSHSALLPFPSRSPLLQYRA